MISLMNNCTKQAMRAHGELKVTKSATPKNSSVLVDGQLEFLSHRFCAMEIAIVFFGVVNALYNRNGHIYTKTKTHYIRIVFTIVTYFRYP